MDTDLLSTQRSREALLAIVDVARLLKTYIDRRGSEHDITRAQWGALARIERAPGSTLAEIAEQMDLAPISLVPILDRLCEQGLIERRAHPGDRRAKPLHLTERGRARLMELEPLAAEIATELFAGMPDAALERLAADLARLKDNIKRAGGPARPPASGASS